MSKGGQSRLSGSILFLKLHLPQRLGAGLYSIRLAARGSGFGLESQAGLRSFRLGAGGPGLDARGPWARRSGALGSTLGGLGLDAWGPWARHLGALGSMLGLDAPRSGLGAHRELEAVWQSLAGVHV